MEALPIFETPIRKIQDSHKKNLTNADNLIWVDYFNATNAKPAGYRLRPRTVGGSFNYHF